MRQKTRTESSKKTAIRITQCIALVLALALMAGYALIPARAADELSGNTVQPVLVVSGQGIIPGCTYTADNTGNEKSYTLDELKDLETTQQLYSTINTTPTRSIFLGKGISVDTLLQESNVAAGDYGTYNIDMMSSDGYTVRFDPAYTGQSATKGKPLKTPAFDTPRYYYPNLKELEVGLDAGNNYTFSNEAAAGVDGQAAKTILAWERGGDRGEPETIPTETEALSESDALLLMVGQQNVWEQSNPLFNKTVNRIIVGDAVDAKPITIDGVAKSRSEILMMERADRTYTYKSGTKTDYVRGVPLSVLLKDYGDEAIVSFTAADGYDMSGSTKTLGELKSGNYMLAYEKGTSAADLNGIFSTAKNDDSIHGYFTLYGDGGVSPAQMINGIIVTTGGNDFTNSPYKHITNGGINGQDGPYDIDAITGATLTIEGPGVVSSIALPIQELEQQNAGAYRGTYSDKRGGTDWNLQYEGIRLSYIINNMKSGANGIILTDNAYKVLIKNRVRQTIAEFTLDDIEAAETANKPVIIAYGTGTPDGNTVAPFVFDGAAGLVPALDNDDGPIKLVYDKSAFAVDPNPNYTEFGNVAYIYIAEQVSPGYKHDTVPYNTPQNSQYVLTVTGDQIGREVNYTVEQLENMVVYTDGAPEAGGMGYRDEYSLSNSTYWYVNEYEGVQLWELLQNSGLPASTATGDQKGILVQFSATDNYKDFDKFTIEQIANPNLFGFYEKNPADPNDGSYSGVPTDLKGTGYPVLVAYGVNAYPYVISSSLDGYMSGLSNDGGPLRIISGKVEYAHANGSKQAKLLDKIIVGTDKYYSTHKYNPNCNGVYQGLADSSTLNVKVIAGASADGPVLKDQTYTVGDLEDILYGGTLTAAQLKEAKVKGFYEAYKNSSFYNDLYEGLNLPYFLQNIVQLPGFKGTITFSDGTGNLTLGLEEVLAFSGYNGTTGLDGLSPVLAYAKNGSPMVNSKKAEDGYEGTVTLAAGTAYQHDITVKNNGGPLAVLFPRASANADTADGLNSITSITINLSADSYAHTEAPYNGLAGSKVIVSGAGTRLNAAKEFTVADIEGKQTLAKTADYNIKKSVDSQSQLRYRGIPLYNFLTSTDIGLKPNADKVIVTCSDNTSYTFNLAEVIKSDYINGQHPEINDLPIMLAYGSAAVTNPDKEDGKPLVKSKDDEGYAADYGNNGGPIRLVTGQIDANDINSTKNLKDVTSIEVTASDLVSWNHSTSAVYEPYLNDTFQLQVVNADNQPLLDKTYTVEQIEAMSSLIERENITWVGTQEWEGINLWDFVLQEAGSITGIADPTTVTVFASDGFSKELRSIFGMDALENGIKDGELRVPIIIGYAVTGYPLVPSNTSAGYEYTVNNCDGPLRLMTHLNQGACLKQTVKVVVKIAGSGDEPTPGTEKDFNIYGLPSGTVAMDIKTIKNITQGSGGKVLTTYNWFGDHDGDSTTDKQATSDYVKGAYLADLLASAGVTGDDVQVNIITTDGFTKDHYQKIPVSDIKAKQYFVAYDKSADGGTTWTGFSDADKSTPPNLATVRIYRNYDDGSSTWYNRVTNVKGVEVLPVVFNVYPADGAAGNLPLAGVRSIWMDVNNGLWVSTYGGGVAYKAAGADTFSIYNKSSTPALATGVVSAVAVDSSGGVWMSQNASYTDPSGNQGVAYMKDGAITYYKATDNPQTIPNNYVQEIQIDSGGNVWFGSFGGLTKYNPATGAWTTWDKSDGFPATSIDNLIFDNQGGIWCGFYPDGAGSQADPFVGGFAYMSKEGNITPYQYTADYDSALGSCLVSQVWVRDIAVDSSGGAWVVASGSYSDLPNVGGNVWHIDSTGQVSKYTGDELLGSGSLTGNSEVRMVNVDPDGGLWFGTTMDGLFYIANPEGAAPFTITGHYSGGTGSWTDTALLNNIYSLDFVDKTVYAGSSGGLAHRTFAFANTAQPPGGGGEVPNDYDLTVNGEGVTATSRYTIAELKNAPGLVQLTKNYNWLNNYGTTGTDEFKGVYLENLLTDVVNMTGDAKSVRVTAGDGYYRNFNLDANDWGVYWKDIQGNQIMLGWERNGSPCALQLVVGQKSVDDVNKDDWVSDITTITVNTETTTSGSGSPGNYTPTQLTDKSKGVAITPTVNGNTANTSVGLDDIVKALEGLKEGSGSEQNGTRILEIDLRTGNANVQQSDVNLSKEALQALAEAGDVSLRVVTDQGVIELPPAVIQILAQGSQEPLRLLLEASNNSGLNDNSKGLVGDRPVLNLSIFKGSQQQNNFGGNQIRVLVPYTAQDNENANGLLVYYINDQGESTPLAQSMYDQENHMMVFETNHLSRYAVGYNGGSFDDIAGNWAKENIEFLAARGIVGGKAAGVFDPAGNVTRAEFVTMLAKSVNGLAISGSNAGFTDVEAGAWYAETVNWAVANGIVSGYGDGRFGPNDLITREQLAVMMDKFIAAVKLNLVDTGKANSFTDQDQISEWARPAVAKMQQCGMINGRAAGVFAPQATTTRAEAATLIKGYIDRELGL